MQLIEVVPSGPLAKLYPKMKIAATSAAEAIEGWSRQIGHVPQVLEAVGFETREKLEASTEVKKLLLYPAMFGGGGNLGKIIIGAALVAIAVVNPGLGFIGINMALSAAGAAAIGALGVSMILTGVMGMFMKQPSLSKEEDPEASKYIGSGENTVAIGTPIPIGGGRVLLGGHYLSAQVNSSDLVYGKFPTTPT